MKLTMIGLGMLAMFVTGCGLLQPAATPVGTTTITSASMEAEDDGLLPRRHAATPPDRIDPWDGTKIPAVDFSPDRSDPWAAPASDLPANVASAP